MVVTPERAVEPAKRGAPEPNKQAKRIRRALFVPDAYPWSSCPPHTRGLLHGSYDALPVELTSVLDMRVDALQFECGRYAYVHNNYGSKGTIHLYGYQVQISVDGASGLRRIGMVEDPRVGALLAVVAFLDTRLRDQTNAGTWLRWMQDPEGGAQAAERWLDEVEDQLFCSPVRVPRGGGPRRSVSGCGAPSA